MVAPVMIKDHMEVIGCDGVHVGTVDHLEGRDLVKLTKDDADAGNEEHFIPLAWVDHVDDHPGPATVLINLRADPPSFFSRFERLAEIVGIDETDVEAGRTRFRFYRERGYELRTHSLAER